MVKMNLNEIFQSVRAASRKLAMWDVETVNALLCAVADRIEEKTDSLLEANREDLLRMEVSNPKYDVDKGTVVGDCGRHASGGCASFPAGACPGELYGAERAAAEKGECAFRRNRGDL